MVNKSEAKKGSSSAKENEVETLRKQVALLTKELEANRINQAPAAIAGEKLPPRIDTEDSAQKKEPAAPMAETKEKAASRELAGQSDAITDPISKVLENHKDVGAIVVLIQHSGVNRKSPKKVIHGIEVPGGDAEELGMCTIMLRNIAKSDLMRGVSELNKHILKQALGED